MFVFMYYMCEKYCTPITVQYHIADCVTWVPRVTLLDLQIGLNKHTLGTELVHMSGTYYTYKWLKMCLAWSTLTSVGCLGNLSAFGKEWEMHHGMGWRVGLGE